VPANKASSDPTTSLTGRILLGRYRIVRPLARGGMGVVYLGRVEGAAGFSKPVVVKTVLTSFGREEETERLFAREARILSNLNHPGVVAVIDFGRVGDACVMVLEYVHGYHLLQWLRFVTETRGKVQVEHAVHAILSVLDTLDYAHRLAGPDGTPLGIVHRDISPANVLIDQAGHIKLSDFGIARMSDDEAKTQEGLFRGTLPYAAPETLHGSSVSPKVDQYGCAAILYHLLAGKNPFKGGDPHQTMTRVLTHHPPPLSSWRKDVPKEIDAAVLRAISKEPEERFANVAEFAEAIRAGVTWSERDAEESFVSEIARDFGGAELPKHFDIESLTERDAAWREEQDVVEHRVALSSSPPSMESGVRPQASDGAKASADTAKPARSSGGRLGLWIALAALAAGVGSAATIALLMRPASEPSSRLVVIEKHEGEPTPTPPTSDPAPATAEPTPAAADSAADPAPSASTSKAKASPRDGAAPPADRGAELARAFQRQEGKIQGCFQQHSTAGEAPSISVRFQIDASGAVQNAIVSPPSVAGTPLGQCIGGVARSTKFDAQPEAVSFSIPIAARVIRR
jgi:serine/threonine-protein kinase